MSANKKPRKAYRPRPVTAQTMTLALHHAAKPAAADRKEVLSMLGSAIKALREGVATEHQWSIAAGSVTVALAIERRGIVRGLSGYINTAEQALQGIYDRAQRTGGGRWMRPTLYFFEIEALNDLVWLHTLQLSKLGRAEFLSAIDAAQKHTIAQGHTARLVHELERMAA
jgi:hypothetical protein